MAGDQEGPVIKAIELLKSKFPDLFIICDVCLCPYTDHGHCGFIDSEGNIKNKKSVIAIGEISKRYAFAGADCIAPSDCMDGRIGYIKNLFRNEELNVPVMSYGSKFCSKMYGPF